MTQQSTFDNRKTITYPGDARGAVGEVKGPTYDGELLTIDEAVYDPERNRSRVWFRYATDADVRAADGQPQPDMATPQFDLPTWLVGAAGYVDVACDGCGTTTRQHGISDPAKGWALCPDCLSQPWAAARVEAKRREIHEEAKRAQAVAIESRRPEVQVGRTVGIRLLGMADGTPSPWDGQWLVEYDPTRQGRDPQGNPTLAHMVTTDDPAQATRYPDAGVAFELWRQPSGNPYPANAPLTAFTVSFEDPEDPA